MAMETPPVEDVCPIKTGDFPASHVGNLGSVGFWPWKGIGPKHKCFKNPEEMQRKKQKNMFMCLGNDPSSKIPCFKFFREIPK